MTSLKETTFEQMVDEAYQNLASYNKTKSVLILPNIKTDIGTTRLHWLNVNEILVIIKRPSDHFKLWLENEIPNKSVNWFSSDKNDGLIVHGKFKKDKEISDLLLKYINIYVVCSSCKSSNTTMTKEQFICDDCGMKKYY